MFAMKYMQVWGCLARDAKLFFIGRVKLLMVFYLYGFFAGDNIQLAKSSASEIHDLFYAGVSQST
ncbi:hypothetical protein [Rivihabitans pingtungensis]|jgi:hypothetical protein|uniref:hypothetical protein n=1 Tax=Rivihabitans pingtungensis TaxID=1054498 RepID=UPI002351FD37|nr:hypothetical protein [Rivihabitans pingtungensis]MCK6437118.1 hypothetical protein [Rivihabitans pingtungensis]